MQAIRQKLNAQGRIVSTVQKLPSGIAGTQKTLALMHESIIATLTNELVIAAAIVAAGIANRATSAKAEVQRVQQWVQKNIRYVLDPLSIELLQSPDVTLTRKQGDCDDQTALLCALLTALGYDCRMVAIGFKPGAFAHVYAEVLIDGKWTAAETIKPWALGKEPEGVQATMRMAVNAEKGAALSGLFKTFKKIAKPIINNPLTRTYAAVQTGGASELYYQGKAAVKAAKSDPVPADAPVSPLPAAAVANVTPAAAAPAAAAPSGIAQYEAFVVANKVPLGIAAAVLLFLVIRK